MRIESEFQHSSNENHNNPRELHSIFEEHAICLFRTSEVQAVDVIYVEVDECQNTDGCGDADHYATSPQRLRSRFFCTMGTMYRLIERFKHQAVFLWIVEESDDVEEKLKELRSGPVALWK